MNNIKKASALFACALLMASALCACDAKDGKIDDNSSVIMKTESRADMTSRKTASRKTASETASVTTDRDNSGDGVLHDTASMVGEVGEDIAQGADNIGSSVTSNLDEAFDASEDTM